MSALEHKEFAMKELPTPTFAFAPSAMPRRLLHHPPHARIQTFAKPASGAARSRDIDLFDDYCEHLRVRDAASQKVIGTYKRR